MATRMPMQDVSVLTAVTIADDMLKAQDEVSRLRRELEETRIKLEETEKKLNLTEAGEDK